MTSNFKAMKTRDYKQDGDYPYLPLPEEVLINKTKTEFGYDPREMKPWSSKKLIIKCFITKKEKIVSRKSINLNKYYKKTGHWASAEAIKKMGTKKGACLSKEAIENISKAQQERRKRERLLGVLT